MLTKDEQEVLRAIDLHGGITAKLATRHGWVNEHGAVLGPLRSLTDKRIVAPRVLTSVPLNVVWQRRETAAHTATLSQIKQTADKQGIKEYAPGGFELKLRKDYKP